MMTKNEEKNSRKKLSEIFLMKISS